MDGKSKIVFRWSVHIAFCLFLVFFFGNFCILRPAARIYKEYLSGVFVLFFIYFNYLVLFPKLFVKAKYKDYVIFSLASVFVAFLFEVILVIPDIVSPLPVQFSSPKDFVYILMDSVYILIRDISFVTATFSVLAIVYYKRLSQSKDFTMLKEFHKIEVTTIEKNSKKIFLPVEEISYCKQEQNFTKIFLSNGQCFLRYGTLKSFSELLDESFAVRVSRNIIVTYSNIDNFNKSGVVIKSQPENIMISYSASYGDTAYRLIANHTAKSIKPVKAAPRKTVKKKTSERHNDKQSDSIYAFIEKHPYCSAAEIKKNREKSQSTVNRILKQLKDEGLIEYAGSKKTGGYRVKL